MPTDMLELTAEEIGEGFWVEVKIKPPSLQDEMTQSQIAQVMRAAGVDGKPMMSDVDINRYVFKREHPEELARNIEMQLFAAQDQEIQKIKQAAMSEVWKKDNADMVKDADRILNKSADKDAAFNKFKKELTPEKLQEMMKLVAMTEQAKLQGIPPEQFIQKLATQEAQQGVAERQAGMLPASVQPPAGAPGEVRPFVAGVQPGMPVTGAPMMTGPRPQAMPSQAMMPMGSQAQTGVNPAAQVTAQMRRGKPINKPSR